MADAKEITDGTANGRSLSTVDEATLQSTRTRIAETAGRIEERLKSDLDWRTWVDRYPLQAAGAVAAVGVLAGLALGSRRSRSDAPIAKEAARTSLVATVASAVATAVVREAARALVERLAERRDPQE